MASFASGRYNKATSDAAEHGIAVDRFAREIAPFLKSFSTARSRQLNASPLGDTV